MSANTLRYPHIGLENLPSLSERRMSFGTDRSSVVSWKYSTSMSLTSSGSSQNSLSYINIETGREDKYKSKSKNYKKKNFVLMNMKNVNSSPKKFSPHIVESHQMYNVGTSVKGGMFPKLNKHLNQNNNHSVSISSVRSQWPENKITQVEQHLKGEVDRLKRSKEDLVKRNRYLEREIAKEHDSFKHSFPGRTLQHLKFRNSILVEEKYEAQKLDADNRTRLEETEENQRKIESKYQQMMRTTERLEEEKKDSLDENDNEKSLQSEQNSLLAQLNASHERVKKELMDATSASDELQMENEKQLDVIEEMKIDLKKAESESIDIQSTIQLNDVENMELNKTVEEMGKVLQSLKNEQKLVKVELDKCKENLSLSHDDASKLLKDVEELEILIAEKENVSKERKSVKENSKNSSCQTRERLIFTRNIAWIRVAEEETVYSAYCDQKPFSRNKSDKTPLVEVFDHAYVVKAVKADKTLSFLANQLETFT